MLSASMRLACRLAAKLKVFVHTVHIPRIRNNTLIKNMDSSYFGFALLQNIDIHRNFTCLHVYQT